MAAPSAHVVGSAFVDQYYHILHSSPELVFRFYQDTSVLTRPDATGAMTSVTTMQAINDMILSLDYKNYRAEIKSADAQESYKGGVMVLVTGCLRKDQMQRKFAQSFFLAPQDKGYFVFNDVFRYLDEEDPQAVSPESSGSVNLTTDPELPELTHVSEHPVVPEPAAPLVEEGLDSSEEVYNGSDNEKELVVDVEVVAESEAHSSQTEVHSNTEADASNVQEDAPKKSYASIVKVTKGDRRSIPVYVPAKNAIVVSRNTEQQSAGLGAPAREVSPRGNNATTYTDTHEEVEDHSIYIRNLPMNVTVTEVEEEFKKFGLIKPDGIQVRNNKQQGYCFGFVQFEASSSMQSAIEASRVTIGGREAIIEQKRTASRGGSGRRRFPPSRVVVRNENFRVRGNFGGGRGFGRTDFGNRGEFSGRERGPSGRSGDGYQRVNQSGNGSAGRQGGDYQTSYS